MLITTEGFVLKNKKYGETDSILTIFTRKAGKVTAIAKGARRPKSNMLAGIQPFCYSEFVLHKGKSMYTVSQCDSKEIFYPIREDLKKLTYCSYLVELIDAVTTEGQTNNRLFNLFGKALYLMKTKDVEIYTIIRSFEINMMSDLGYRPQLTSCVQCGNKESSTWRFSATGGGVLCSKCFSTDPFSMKIGLTTIKLSIFLLMKDMKEVHKLKISDSLNEELKKILKQYILTHLNVYEFKSLDLADKL